MEQTDIAAQAKRGDDVARKIIKPYKTLIAKTQQELSGMPIEQRVYRSLKLNSASYLGAPVNLKTKLVQFSSLCLKSAKWIARA